MSTGVHMPVMYQRSFTSRSGTLDGADVLGVLGDFRPGRVEQRQHGHAAAPLGVL